MLDAVAGPAGRAAAQGVNAVAAIGAGQHHLSACSVILRIFQTLPGIDHQALQSRLHEAVRQQGGILAEVLLHDVVHGIRAACRCLFL